MNPSMLYKLCGILKCHPKDIIKKLCLGRTKELLVSLLQHQKYRTNYFDRNGERKVIQVDGITSKGADKIKALGNLQYPYNCTIVQFFMLRHNIRLKYPFLPCFEMNTSFGKQFYPLELTIIDDSYTQLEHDSYGYEEGALRKADFEDEVKKFWKELEADGYVEYANCKGDEEVSEGDGNANEMKWKGSNKMGTSKANSGGSNEEEDEEAEEECDGCQEICANLLAMIRKQKLEMEACEDDSEENESEEKSEKEDESEGDSLGEDEEAYEAKREAIKQNDGIEKSRFGLDNLWDILEMITQKMRGERKGMKYPDGLSIPCTVWRYVNFSWEKELVYLNFGEHIDI